MKKLRAALPSGTDVTGIAGALLLSIGAGMVYRPAGFIVSGLLLLAGALLAARD